MAAARLKLLIVDDEAMLRRPLSAILERVGYDIRCAEDGFTALAEIRRDMPHMMLSDLNMPGMSGYELLSVVRRNYPGMRVAAMNGATTGDGLPPGVAADAYYVKGTSLTLLVNLLRELATVDDAALIRRVDANAPVWIALNSDCFEEASSISLSCPDCMRTFSLMLDVSAQLVRQATCPHCSAPVYYAIVESLPLPLPLQFKHRIGAPTM